MFDQEFYTSWIAARLKAILDYYGEDFFKDKTVLEVGCGWANISQHLHELGANITVSDGREEHIKVIKGRYPEFMALVVDSEITDWLYPEDRYDIIIHFGLLYHLNNPDENLKMISKHCQTLILETTVLDSSDPNRILFKSEETNWNKGAWGTAMSAIGCIPSYGYVENVLEQSNMKYTTNPKPELANASGQTYTWEKKNNGGFNEGQRAMWFCERR